MFGGSGNDLLTGDSQSNILRGNAGNDVIDGGAGVDTLDESNATVNLTIDLNSAMAQNSGQGNDTFLNFKNVLTGSGNDVITGNGSNNILRGGAGDDTYRFRDGWGADTVVDTSGDDTIELALASNGVTFDIANFTVSSGANTLTYLGIGDSRRQRGQRLVCVRWRRNIQRRD